jgi:hypothetical protein
MAIRSASAFQDLANNFIEPARNLEPEKAKQFLLDNFGHLIASATNMSFAIEIYLKAIISHLGVEPKNTHDLLKLFNSLPNKVGSNLEAKFNKSPKSHVGKVGCFHLHSNPNLELSNKEFDIKSILLSSKDAFVTWRYLYENTEGEAKGDAVYEFHSLEMFASILKEYLLGELKNTHNKNFKRDC